MSEAAKAKIDRAAWVRRVDESMLVPLSAPGTEINKQFSPCSELKDVRAARAQLEHAWECDDTIRSDPRRQFAWACETPAWLSAAEKLGLAINAARFG